MFFFSEVFLTMHINTNLKENALIIYLIANSLFRSFCETALHKNSSWICHRTFPPLPPLHSTRKANFIYLKSCHILLWLLYRSCNPLDFFAYLNITLDVTYIYLIWRQSTVSYIRWKLVKRSWNLFSLRHCTAKHKFTLLQHVRYRKYKKFM